ncbi:hypothetical protein Tco_0198152, partial [Tanacetum coccineum]
MIFFKSEEAYKSTKLPRGDFPEKCQGTSYRGNQPPRAGYGGGQQRTDNHNNFNRKDHYQLYVSSSASNRRYDNRRQEVKYLGLDALTKRPKEILATELQLQLPTWPPMIETPKNENLDRSVNPKGEGNLDEYLITFPSALADDVSDEPLVIEAEIEGYLVRRVFSIKGPSS